MAAIEEIENALTLARVRLDEAPDFELFVSTVAQLEYLLSVVKGDERDRSRLKDIIVGHFAVREFEENDPEFAQALNAAQFIASKAARGLKV
ncbi:immunity protein Tsi6 family protein [Pseudoduganella namucuonensis]|uniref:immunity protein Tsi6 family protein n=1 Tax=Pseudoduganella namucuonensis TaxID=1035707 RepID=UPI0011600D41|nr:immunity protein Tsi6 family protein [Pseudoduganella namucuonensis]